MQPNDLIPDLPCACATLRRAARAVSQIYGEEFGELLEGPQFSLLALLHRQAGVSQTTLGRILILDKTTLSRSLSLMKRKGWIEPAPGEDKRERGFQLTPTGKQLLQRARPAWKRAQNRLHAALGEAQWTRMFGVANSVARVAWQAQHSTQDPITTQVPA